MIDNVECLGISIFGVRQLVGDWSGIGPVMSQGKEKGKVVTPTNPGGPLTPTPEFTFIP